MTTIFDSGVGASVDIDWQTSQKTPRDFSFTLRNRGRPGINDRTGFRIIADDGNLADTFSTLPNDQIPFKLNHIFQFEMGKEDGGISREGNRSLPGRTYNMTRFSVLAYSRTEEEARQGLYHPDQIFPILVPDTLRGDTQNQTPFPSPMPSPTPKPTPSDFAYHQITIRYKDIFGLGDDIAQRLAASFTLPNKIQALLGSNFTITNMTVDEINNEVLIDITEHRPGGAQVIPIAIVIAIVAVVVAVVGLIWYAGYSYRENSILKKTVEAKQNSENELQAVLDDQSLTEAQKLAKIKEIVNASPDVVIPDGGVDLPGIGLGISAGAVLALGAVAILASRK